MAIASNPSLEIDVKYNQKKSDKDFRKLTSKVEAQAQAHEQKLNAILQKSNKNLGNLSSSYFVNSEGALKKHQQKVASIVNSTNASQISAAKRFHNTQLSGYRGYYNNLEQLSSRQRGVFQKEAQQLKTVLPGVKNYTTQVAGLNAAMAAEVKAGTVGSLLLGGAAGVGLTASKGGTLLETITGAGGFDAVKRGLGSVHRYIVQEMKSIQNEISFRGSNGEDIAGFDTVLDKLENLRVHSYNAIKTAVATEKDYNKTLEEGNKQFSVADTYQQSIAFYAKASAVAFGAWKLTQFILDIGVASAKTEQMYNTFKGIGGSAGLLSKFRANTFSAVSDQQLLGTINYGHFMGIDIQKMPELLKFASLRAMETGQSIDYMVQSIVTGLGRKSPLILDNLGLKLSDLDAEVLKLAQAVDPSVKKVTDLEREFFLTDAAAAVAQKAIQDSKVDVDNLAISADQAKTSWANFLDEIGRTKSVKSIGGWIIEELGADLDVLEAYAKGISLNDLYAQRAYKNSNPDMSWLPNSYYNNPVLPTMSDKDRYKYEKQKAESEAGASSHQKTYLEQLAEQIKNQKKLRGETLKYINVLNDYAKQYQGNYDVLKLVNEELEKQKKILSELDNYSRANDKSGALASMGGTARGVEVVKGSNYDSSGQIKFDLPNMSSLSNVYTDVAQFTSQNDAIRESIEQYQKLASTFVEGSEEAIYLKNQIKQLQEQLKQRTEETNFSDDMNNFLQKWGPVVSESANLIGTAFDSVTASLNNQLDVMREIINAENERWQLQSENMEAAGLNNTAYYVKLKKDHDETLKRMQSKEKALQASAWDADKNAKIAGVIMNTAQGIMAAWATNPVVGAIMSGIIAATGAIQLATVVSQSNPYKRAFGGWIPGEGYGDSVPTLLTPGEFVVNRQAARENAGLLENINSGRRGANSSTNVFVTIEGNIIGNQDFVETSIIPGIKEALSKGYTLN